jgi:hypothetical protein
LGDVFIHFNEDEVALAAVLGVLLEHGVGGGAGTGEAVKNDGIFIGSDLQDALNQQRRLGCGEIRYRRHVMQHFAQLFT